VRRRGGRCRGGQAIVESGVRDDRIDVRMAVMRGQRAASVRRRPELIVVSMLRASESEAALVVHDVSSNGVADAASR
jgi:hypothetical protein